MNTEIVSQWLRKSVVFVLLAALVAGCAVSSTSLSGHNGAALASEPSTNLVTVPDIEGLGATQAEAVLRSVGLVPADIPVHGPIDEDAADIALAYRQSPRPGSTVSRGSKVSFRWWWEAG
jgi:beta-lactam-binding protein with PASTA domain